MREMIDITSDTKLIRVLCEQRFLSSMAFSAYKVVHVACLAGYSKSNDSPKVLTWWKMKVVNLGQCLTVVSAKPTLALVLPQSLLDQCIFQVNWNKPVILRNETTNESVWRLFQNFLWNISVVFTKLDWKLEMLEKSSVHCSLAGVCTVILYLWKAFENTQPGVALLNHSSNSEIGFRDCLGLLCRALRLAKTLNQSYVNYC